MRQPACNAALARALKGCDERLLADAGVRCAEDGSILPLAMPFGPDGAAGIACGSAASLRSAPIQWRAWLAKADRVALAIGAFFIVLLALDPEQARESASFTLDQLFWVSPFILLSAALAAAISASGADHQLGRVFTGHPTRTILAAAIFGALSPFCSCSVVPLIAALLAARVPLAPVMAFWIASPLMDPESFILTVAIIDLPFALARTAVALGLGVLAGLATHLVASRMLAEPLRANPLSGAASVWSAPDLPALADGRVAWRFWRRAERRQAFARQAMAIFGFLFKWLALAYALESLLVAYLPGPSVAALTGGGEWWVIPASVAIGIPTYLNGYAALPLIGELLDKGMQPGAAMGFLVSGEITSIPSAMAVFMLVRTRVFAWYLLVGILGALLAGFGYQLVLSLL